MVLKARVTTGSSLSKQITRVSDAASRPLASPLLTLALMHSTGNPRRTHSVGMPYILQKFKAKHAWIARFPRYSAGQTTSQQDAVYFSSHLHTYTIITSLFQSKLCFKNWVTPEVHRMYRSAHAN